MAYGYELRRHVKLDDLLAAPNVVDLLDGDDVAQLGTRALDGYMEDKRSRTEWEERMSAAMKLALQVVEEKTFPWPNAANVKFPLITVAALQYHARAYPALISGNDLVKCRVIGEDPQGQKSARAYRVATHMSWQCLEQDTAWEAVHDKLFLVQSIIGCAFVKKLWDPAKRHITTHLVLPKDLVVNYYTRDLATSPRYTQTFELTPNRIKQNEVQKFYTEIDVAMPDQTQQDALTQAQNDRQGMRPPASGPSTPFLTGEQYCWMDLDGDGFEEPYILTFDVNTGKVRRIVARFLPSGIRKEGDEVYEITPISIFTKYGFIPSPDGGFYDLGLGMLLGPLNESVNTALNQIFDAGTMATLGGGFVGRGFKSRGGPFSFRPFEWYPVDAPGDDLRKNVLPLPVREPSNVLFQVLGLLIPYAERIASAGEVQMGENPGQNTKAETVRTLNENGARVYNAIYKRTWRDMRDEDRVQYDLNKLYLTADEDYEDLTKGSGAMIRPDDYSGSSLDVRPAADPHVVSDTERIERAMVVFKNSMMVPGHNRYQATKRLYRAMQIPAIDEILPPPMVPGPNGQPQPAPDYPPPPNPKMLKVQLEQKELQLKVAEFKSDQMNKVIEMQTMLKKNSAEILKLYAQAAKAMAEAKGVDISSELAKIQQQIDVKTERNDDLLKLIEIMQKGMEGGATGPEGTRGGVEAASQHPALPAPPAGVRGNGQAGLAGGGVPF